MNKILIIGGGIAATALAAQLAGKVHVTVVDKSRGLGGRMAVRRKDSFEFDHGAQFFTSRSEEFQGFLSAAQSAGSVAEWAPRLTTLERGKDAYKREWFEPHFVAAPSMNSLCKQSLLALQAASQETFELRLGTQIAPLPATRSEDTGQWPIADSEGNEIGHFDYVVSSAPSRQTQDLFVSVQFAQQAALAKASHLPCFSLLVACASQPELHFDLAVVKNSPVALIVDNLSKPGRSARGSLLIHSDNHWARDHLEDELEDVRDALIAELLALIPLDAEQIAHTDLHRWRFAKTEIAAEADFLFDEQLGLAACGDWCLGGRVEDAFLSGHRLGKNLLAKLG